MRSLIFRLIIALIILGTSACTIFKKTISRPVVVAYNESEIFATLSSSAWNTKYIGNFSPEQITDIFLENFKSEAASTQNVTLVNSEKGADFILKFKSLSISESSKTEKISDSKSPNNGMEVVLNSVDACATFEIIDAKNRSKKLMDCSNIKSRSEKLKNNRDAGDLLFGTNKDKTEYRSKLLSDDICKNLAQDVGRRIWVPITRRIAKNLR